MNIFIEDEPAESGPIPPAADETFSKAWKAAQKETAAKNEVNHKLIEPTVGRILWYWNSPDQAQDPAYEPMAAMIVHVHSWHKVNLITWDNFGNSTTRENCRLMQEGAVQSFPTLHGFCEWMPYQVGQAAKVEWLDSIPDENAQQLHEQHIADTSRGSSLKPSSESGPQATNNEILGAIDRLVVALADDGLAINPQTR